MESVASGSCCVLRCPDLNSQQYVTMSSIAAHDDQIVPDSSSWSSSSPNSTGFTYFDSFLQMQATEFDALDTRLYKHDLERIQRIEEEAIRNEYVYRSEQEKHRRESVSQMDDFFETPLPSPFSLSASNLRSYHHQHGFSPSSSSSPPSSFLQHKTQQNTQMPTHPHAHPHSHPSSEDVPKLAMWDDITSSIQRLDPENVEMIGSLAAVAAINTTMPHIKVEMPDESTSHDSYNIVHPVAVKTEKLPPLHSPSSLQLISTNSPSLYTSGGNNSGNNNASITTTSNVATSSSTSCSSSKNHGDGDSNDNAAPINPTTATSHSSNNNSNSNNSNSSNNNGNSNVNTTSRTSCDRHNNTSISNSNSNNNSNCPSISTSQQQHHHHPHQHQQQQQHHHHHQHPHQHQYHSYKNNLYSSIPTRIMYSCPQPQSANADSPENSLMAANNIRRTPPPPYPIPPAMQMSRPTQRYNRRNNPELEKRRIHHCNFLGCKKVYTKSSHLKAHQRIHTGY